MEALRMATHPRSPEFPALLQDKQGEVYQVREYTPEDRPALELFYREFEPKRAAQGLPPKDGERIGRWLDSILPQGIHLLTLRAGILVGHALLVPAGADGVSEYAVFLHRDLRGRGLGTALNRAAIEAARSAGLRSLWLSVEPHNRAALRSYEKAGFTLIPGTMFSSEAEMRLSL
jgi:ribosomal protein S18 acetylase RimI-like enzyme